MEILSLWKNKLLGIVFILLGILSLLITDGECTVMLFMMFLGVFCFIVKDDFFSMEEDEPENKHNNAE